MSASKHFAVLIYSGMTQYLYADQQGPVTVNIGPYDTVEQLHKEVQARFNYHLTEVHYFEASLRRIDRVSGMKVTQSAGVPLPYPR